MLNRRECWILSIKTFVYFKFNIEMDLDFCSFKSKLTWFEGESGIFPFDYSMFRPSIFLFLAEWKSKRVSASQNSASYNITSSFKHSYFHYFYKNIHTQTIKIHIPIVNIHIPTNFKLNIPLLPPRWWNHSKRACELPYECKGPYNELNKICDTGFYDTISFSAGGNNLLWHKLMFSVCLVFSPPFQRI